MKTPRVPTPRAKSFPACWAWSERRIGPSPTKTATKRATAKRATIAQFDATEGSDASDGARVAAAVVRPFASLPPLPPDVNDAFEAYKLCILRHKLAGWQEISRDDLLLSLDALKQLALQPADA